MAGDKRFHDPKGRGMAPHKRDTPPLVREAGAGTRNTDERICLIVNPGAAAGRARTQLDDIRRAVDRAFVQWDVRVTEGPGHAEELAAAALGQPFDLVAAVGGDGTCHEVVNGFFDGDVPRTKTCAFAVIPMGTGSDLVRTLGTPACARCRVVGGGDGRHASHRRRLRRAHWPGREAHRTAVRQRRRVRRAGRRRPTRERDGQAVGRSRHVPEGERGERAIVPGTAPGAPLGRARRSRDVRGRGALGVRRERRILRRRHVGRTRRLDARRRVRRDHARAGAVRAPGAGGAAALRRSPRSDDRCEAVRRHVAHGGGRRSVGARARSTSTAKRPGAFRRLTESCRGQFPSGLVGDTPGSGEPGVGGVRGHPARDGSTAVPGLFSLYCCNNYDYL